MTTDFDRLVRRARHLRDQRERPRVHPLDILIYGNESAADEALDQALDQLLADRGRTPEAPLEGIGVEGLYVLIRALHLELDMQSAQPARGGMLDAMHLRGEDADGSYGVVIYNLVIHQDQAWPLL